MQLDVLGRLENMHLGPRHYLLPVFEAIVNGMQATAEAGLGEKGEVRVRFERAPLGQRKSKKPPKRLPAIHSVIVSDNGIGFTDDNFESFRTSDSRKKKAAGGKGVGRFTWLKIFARVEVESRFKNGDDYRKRVIKFSTDLIPPVNEDSNEASAEKVSGTFVKLQEFKAQFAKKCPRDLRKIANDIIEHCLASLIHAECPRIVVEDGYDAIDLNADVQASLKEKGATAQFKIGAHDFELVGLRLFSKSKAPHSLVWCAHNRAVSQERLGSLIPNLVQRLKDADGHAFRYVAYLSGKFLDDRVNAERTGFSIAAAEVEATADGEEDDEGDDVDLGGDTPSTLTDDEDPEDEDLDLNEQDEGTEAEQEPTLRSIRSSVAQVVGGQLKAEIERVQVEKEKHVQTYIETDAPHYRFILKSEPERLESLAPNLKAERLESELHRIKFEIERDARAESRAILSQAVDSIANPEEYEKKVLAAFEKMNEVGKSALVEYVVHRKVILDLFERSLKINHETDKYEREDAIHKMIFPLRKESDELHYEKHNLWLIDDRLSYHYYLASDVPLKDNQITDSISKDRPDIIIFNRPFALTDSSGLTSMAIIEFKRPGRDDDDPIEQVFRYVREIRGNSLKDKDGRPLNLPQTAPVYAYVICDIDGKFRDLATEKNLIESPDRKGYFYYHGKLCTYLEVISYQKLVDDAKQRNRAFFERLKL